MEALAGPAVGYASDGSGHHRALLVRRVTTNRCWQALTLRQQPSCRTDGLRRWANPPPAKPGQNDLAPGRGRGCHLLFRGAAKQVANGTTVAARSRTISPTMRHGSSTDIDQYRGCGLRNRLSNAGHVLLEALNIVEHDDLAAAGIDTAETIHLEVEALKLARRSPRVCSDLFHRLLRSRT